MDNLNEKTYDKLVSILKDSKILVKDLVKTPCIRRPASSHIWYKFCVAIFHEYEYKHQLNIKKWLKKDTFNFKSILLKKFFASEENSKDSNSIIRNDKSKKLILKFSFDKWQEIIKDFKTAEDVHRPKFHKGFNSILSKELQNQNIKCWLDDKYNWFNKSKPYWRGKYCCIECGCAFKTKIINNIKDEPVFIEIEYNENEIKHHEENVESDRKLKCTGEERKILGLELLAFGTSKIKAINIINNSNPENKRNNIFYLFPNSNSRYLNFFLIF